MNLLAKPEIFAQRYAVRINDEFTIDVMPSAGGVGWDELRPHIKAVTIDDQAVQVLDLPGLLKTKQGSRPKDQMDAAVISAALKALDKNMNLARSPIRRLGGSLRRPAQDAGR